MENEIKKHYIRATKIVDKSENVTNENVIFTNDYDQIFLTDKNCLVCYGKGHIILDFGKEICGGIRILASYLEGQKSVIKLRVRFGESLSEANADIGYKNATNNHAVRDLICECPDLSDFEVGGTGFRFVRIDFLTEDKYYYIKNIVGYSLLRDIPYYGDFKCDDELLNKIFDTSRYTIHLCSQNMIWDGIKRDRLVWIGDMQPEVLAALYTFGGQEFIKKSLVESEKHYPLPIWFGAMPTYSAWYMRIISDYYSFTGDKEFTKDRINYINGIITQFLDSVDNDGHIDYSRAKPTQQRDYFIDWPSSENPQLEEGNRYLLIYIFNTVLENLKDFPIDKDGLNTLINRLLKGKKNEILDGKQLASFQVLSNEFKNSEIYKFLIKDGASGLSTYMSYFILSAIAKFDINSANEILKQYYGGMLSMGATSFWEDFDIDWMNNSCRIDELPKEGQKDIHGDHGKYCYKGFRHSLCHGWSSGPVQYVFDNIVGVKILEPGFKKVEIKPNLGNLKCFRATIPTPYGLIKVEADNSLINIEAPKEIEVIK